MVIVLCYVMLCDFSRVCVCAYVCVREKSKWNLRLVNAVNVYRRLSTVSCLVCSLTSFIVLSRWFNTLCKLIVFQSNINVARAPGGRRPSPRRMLITSEIKWWQMGTFVSKGVCVCVNISIKIWSFFQRMSPTVETCSVSLCCRTYHKDPIDPDSIQSVLLCPDIHLW